MNLAAILTESAERHGDRPALKLDDTTVTYSMLDEGSARVSGLLREKGVEPGDRVGNGGEVAMWRLSDEQRALRLRRGAGEGVRQGVPNVTPEHGALEPCDVWGRIDPQRHFRPESLTPCDVGCRPDPHPPQCPPFIAASACATTA